MSSSLWLVAFPCLNFNIIGRNPQILDQDSNSFNAFWTKEHLMKKMVNHFYSILKSQNKWDRHSPLSSTQFTRLTIVQILYWITSHTKATAQGGALTFQMDVIGVPINWSPPLEKGSKFQWNIPLMVLVHTLVVSMPDLGTQVDCSGWSRPENTFVSSSLGFLTYFGLSFRDTYWVFSYLQILLLIWQVKL